MLDVFFGKIQTLKPKRRFFVIDTDRDNFAELIKLYAQQIREFVYVLEAGLSNYKFIEELKEANYIKFVLTKDILNNSEAEQYFRIIKELDFSELPFKTYRVKKRINNIFILKALLDGEEIEIMDRPFELNKIYFCWQNNIYIGIEKGWEMTLEPDPKGAKRSIRVPVVRKVDKGPKYQLSEFFEEDVTDVQYDIWEKVGQDENGEDIYKGYFEKPESLAQLRVLEQKMSNIINKYLEIIEKEKIAGEGKLSNAKNMRDFYSPVKFLDRNFYYVNKDDYRNIYCIADLHGSGEALKKCLEKTRIFDSQKANNLWIFLGDYVDRGTRDFWTLYHVLKLKTLYPDNVIILKGNHENYPIEDGQITCPHVPNDFFEYMFASKKTQEDGMVFSDNLRDLMFKKMFKSLPAGVFLKGKETYFISHAAFIYQTVEIEWKLLFANNYEYEKIKIDRYPETSKLEDFNSDNNLRALMWTKAIDYPYRNSMPRLDKEICLYSQANFLDKFGLSKVIRGHDHPTSGLEIIYKGKLYELNNNEIDEEVMQQGQVYTIFSAGGNEDLINTVKYQSVILCLDENERILPILLGGSIEHEK